MRAVCTLTAILLLLVASGVSVPAEKERPLYGGAIQRLAKSQPGFTDPALVRTVLEREAASLDHIRLLSLDGDGNIKPEAIEAWSYSVDSLSLSLKLRQGIRDISGNALTAEDIAASFHRVLRENPGSPAAGLLLDLEGAESYMSGESEGISGVSVEDASTITLNLIRPQPLLLNALADINLAPALPVNESTGWGPFILAGAGRYEPDMNFVRGRPFVDHLFLGGSPEVQSDWRRPVLVRVGHRITEVSDEPVRIDYPGRRCVYLAANRRDSIGPLRLLDARSEALGAVDAESLVSIFLAGRTELLEHVVPPGALPGGAFALPTGPVSGIKPLRRLAIGFPEGSEELELIAGRVRVDLLVSGISADVIPFSSDTAGDCDLLLIEALIAEGSAAYSFWGSLCELYSLTGDDIWLRKPSGDDVAWLVDMEQSLRSEAMLVPLYHTAHFIWADPRIRDLGFRPDGTLDYEGAWIAEGSRPAWETSR